MRKARGHHKVLSADLVDLNSFRLPRRYVDVQRGGPRRVPGGPQMYDAGNEEFRYVDEEEPADEPPSPARRLRNDTDDMTPRHNGSPRSHMMNPVAQRLLRVVILLQL